MSPSVLAGLLSPDFQSRVGFVATAAALRRLLKRSPEVHAITKALGTGELVEESIRKFTDSLMKDLRRGEPFCHDLAVSALAVALERRGTDFAEEFIRDLAQLKAAEMAMSIRVARECRKGRVSLAGNKSSIVRLTPPQNTNTVPYEAYANSYRDQQVGQTREVLQWGGR